MPPLRDVHPDEAVTAFERLGGLVRSGKGSHVNVKMPNGSLLTFPRHHGAVKVGLLRAMLRRAQVGEDEFIAALRRRR